MYFCAEKRAEQDRKCLLMFDCWSGISHLSRKKPSSFSLKSAQSDEFVVNKVCVEKIIIKESEEKWKKGKDEGKKLRKDKSIPAHIHKLLKTFWL